MQSSRLRLFLAAVILGALLLVAVRGAGPVPPLGRLLDPANGVWGLARTAEFPRRKEAGIPGLTAPVEVIYDDRGVPHIFAASEEDAWRAQGYVVARDRLFQLELQTRAASGTLAELVGPRALDADLATRRRGFARAAERNFGTLDSTSLYFRAAKAYAEGVNAWIDGLARAELPLEYRLLQARPARWEPVNTYYLFLQMSYTLSWSEPTTSRLAAQELIGAEATEALFPLNSPIQEPIQPNGAGAASYNRAPLPPPGTPDPAAWIAGPALAPEPIEPPRSREAVGSNNWAVAPHRTAAGHALLAGDPHLELTLPSIWYEVHLQVPGGPEVAGVSLPGSPGVIIGFNRSLAWSFTNSGADVRDHFRETVDDPARPARYRLDGEWKALELREEVVRGRNGEVLLQDTVRFTHRGPLTRMRDQWVSVRWTPLEARFTGEEFLRLDRAQDHAEWLAGWQRFEAPAQNGIVADRSGTIAIRTTGRFPIRPGDGRGDLIRDGSTSASDWVGQVATEHYPFAENPRQGFLASANQQPVDPADNRAYLGSDWYSPWRAIRINQLLRADSAVTPGAMQQFQTDAMSARAEAFVPYFLVAGPSPAMEWLSAWDRRYTRESRAPVLFEAAMSELVPLVWDELIAPAGGGNSTRPVAVPEDAVLLRLMADSTSDWWDDRRTPEVERRDAILTEALRRGYETTVRRHGPIGEGWRWDRVHQANIWHLLRVRALSALELPVSGGPSTLSPSPGSGTHGASWRMVVELGPEVRAAATYPGGQSGNPASARYDDRVDGWLAGELDPVLFPARAQDLPPERVRSRLVLRPLP